MWMWKRVGEEGRGQCGCLTCWECGIEMVGGGAGACKGPWVVRAPLRLMGAKEGRRLLQLLWQSTSIYILDSYIDSIHQDHHNQTSDILSFYIPCLYPRSSNEVTPKE